MSIGFLHIDDVLVVDVFKEAVAALTFLFSEVYQVATRLQLVMSGMHLILPTMIT